MLCCGVPSVTLPPLLCLSNQEVTTPAHSHIVAPDSNIPSVQRACTATSRSTAMQTTISKNALRLDAEKTTSISLAMAANNPYTSITWCVGDSTRNSVPSARGLRNWYTVTHARQSTSMMRNARYWKNRKEFAHFWEWDLPTDRWRNHQGQDQPICLGVLLF